VIGRGGKRLSYGDRTVAADMLHVQARQNQAEGAGDVQVAGGPPSRGPIFPQIVTGGASLFKESGLPGMVHAQNRAATELPARN